MPKQKLTIAGVTYEVDITPGSDGNLLVTVDGKEYVVSTAGGGARPVPQKPSKGRARHAAPAQDPKLICSPLPGRVVAVKVALNDKVQEGTPLIVIESMKMQNTIKSAVKARVAEICVKPNDSIAKNQTLIKLE